MTLDENHLLILTYFNQKIGPSVFYCNNLSDSNKSELNEILNLFDLIKSGSFSYSKNNYKTLNYMFYIDSPLLRGKEVSFMITYLIRADRNRIFNGRFSLEEKIFEDFAHNIKNLEDISNVLYELTISNTGKFKSIYSKQFKKEFQDLYFKYKELLSSSLIELKPHDIEISLIKFNIPTEYLIKTIRAVLHKKNVLIISSKLKKISNAINNFFLFIFEKSFKFNISIKTKKEYRILSKNNDNNEEYVVLKKKFLKSSKKRKDSENSIYVEDIIKEFYIENDPIPSVMKLKEEIYKIYTLTLKAINYYEYNGKIIIPKVFIKYLKRTYYLKVKKDYIYFLVDIIKKYFKKDVKLSRDYLLELVSQMWGE